MVQRRRVQFGCRRHRCRPRCLGSSLFQVVPRHGRADLARAGGPLRCFLVVPPGTGIHTYLKGIPKCFCWPSGFLEASGTKTKNTHRQTNMWFWGPAAFGGKANKNILFWKRCGTPGLQKIWPQKHFGIPLTYPMLRNSTFGGPEGRIWKLSRLRSGRNPARKLDFRPGSTTA